MAVTGIKVPTILIDNLKFLLYKSITNTDPINVCTLEIGDVVDGAIPNGFLLGTYLGGDSTDFNNSLVYDNWGGMIITI